MGKQILLHLIDSDLRTLLDCIEQTDPVLVVLRSSDSAKVTTVEDPLHERREMTLWNKRLVGFLARELIRRPGGKEYYRVDGSLPTLELSPSRPTTWDGKPALLQGRIYGLFDEPTREYESWYRRVTRCVRATASKNPLKTLNGYVGPEALRWFHTGGIFLPMFEPPTTHEWKSFVGMQHDVTDASTPGNAV